MQHVHTICARACSMSMQHDPLRCVPQAELHLHIEGTLEPGMLLRLSERNKLTHSLPFRTLEEAKAAYNFKNLQQFLDLYYEGSAAALVTQQVWSRQGGAVASAACTAATEHAACHACSCLSMHAACELMGVALKANACCRTSTSSQLRTWSKPGQTG